MRIFIEAACGGEPGGFSLVESAFNRTAHTYTDSPKQLRFAEWSTCMDRSQSLFLWKSLIFSFHQDGRLSGDNWECCFLPPSSSCVCGWLLLHGFTNVTEQLYFLLKPFTMSINCFWSNKLIVSHIGSHMYHIRMYKDKKKSIKIWCKRKFKHIVLVVWSSDTINCCLCWLMGTKCPLQAITCHK